MNLRELNLPDDNDVKKLTVIFDSLMELTNSLIEENRLSKEKLGEFKPLKMMIYLFLERVNYQNKSFFHLSGFSDSILISRSMFEGALFLAYSAKNVDKEIAYRWKLSLYVDFVNDMSREDFPLELRNEIDDVKSDLDKFFLSKDKKSYHNKWLDKNIFDVAKDLDDVCQTMYREYYQPMAKYHHWDFTQIISMSHVNSTHEGSKFKVLLGQFNSYLIAIFSNLLIIKLFVEFFPKDIQGKSIVKSVNDLEEQLGRISFIKTKKVKLTTRDT